MLGVSTANHGVYGTTATANFAGIFGTNNALNSRGVWGIADNGGDAELRAERQQRGGLRLQL